MILHVEKGVFEVARNKRRLLRMAPAFVLHDTTVVYNFT